MKVNVKYSDDDDDDDHNNNNNNNKKIIIIIITPLVVGSLGALPKQFGNRLKETGITAELGKFRRQFY